MFEGKVLKRTPQNKIAGPKCKIHEETKRLTFYINLTIL